MRYRFLNRNPDSIRAITAVIVILAAMGVGFVSIRVCDTVEAATQRQGLVVPTEAAGPLGLQGDPLVRSRFVTINRAVFGRLGESDESAAAGSSPIPLNLFGGTYFSAVVNRSKPGSFGGLVLSGHVAGVPVAL